MWNALALLKTNLYFKESWSKIWPPGDSFCNKNKKLVLLSLILSDLTFCRSRKYREHKVCSLKFYTPRNFRRDWWGESVWQLRKWSCMRIIHCWGRNLSSIPLGIRVSTSELSKSKHIYTLSKLISIWERTHWGQYLAGLFIENSLSQFSCYIAKFHQMYKRIDQYDSSEQNRITILERTYSMTVYQIWFCDRIRCQEIKLPFWWNFEQT